MSVNTPDDRLYHKGHLWAKKEADGSVLVGITDYAQQQLESVIFVDMPAAGAHFAQGESCASIESVKVTSEALMPLAGTVLAVNDALADTPELLNDDPYGAGWLIRVQPDDAALPDCMDAAAYAASL